MTDADYPATRVEESGTPCIALSRLPELPVRVLVLGPAVDTERPLGPRLEHLASDLGAGDGLQVVAGDLGTWQDPLEGVPAGRFDVVILRAAPVPGGDGDPEHAPPWLVESMAAALAVSSTRVWLVTPSPTRSAEEGARREDLARRVVRAGGPPAVVLPGDWLDQDPATFLEATVEHLLHDAPLGTAVERATADRRPAPLLLRPQGRRLGLDLARLLESHRTAIEEQVSRLRSFEREFEATRTASGMHPAFEALNERLQARGEALVQVKESCEEINRDRDPAGWSRLGNSIARLSALTAEEEADRAALRATAMRVAEQGG